MRILSLEIQDILSIENTSISFDDNGLVLVEGWNYDTNRANGAGKTAIFNGLAFSIYDKLPRKITVSEILRRGCKSGFAKASILCGEDVWTVQRFRPKGVKFFKNGVEQTISQEEFESAIRLSYQQFLLTIYTPQASSGGIIRFLNSPDSSKKEFLLQLLNLDQFSEAKKAADDIIKQHESVIDGETSKLNTVNARIETYQESLVDAESLQDTINAIKSLIFPVQREINELSNVQKPDLSKFASTEDGIRIKMSEIAQAKAKRGLLHDKHRELQSLVQDYDSSNACGECGSSLDTPEARVAHDDHQENIKQKIAALKSEIDSLDSAISKQSSIDDLARKLRDKKNQESSDYQAAQLRISELNSFIRTKTAEMKNAELKIASNLELLSKINALESARESHALAITSSKRQLELYKTISSIYSPTGAQAYVLDSIVDSFNEVIQKYIDMLSPNMTYTLNSFKETSKGDVVAKFSETLMKGGQEVSVGSLSGGEEKGLSLCVDFALLEVLEIQFGMSLNPIILDEPFDGLDVTGREIVVDLLESLAKDRQIFVIDHSSEAKSMFSKVIRAELRNGISTISTQV